MSVFSDFETWFNIAKVSRSESAKNSVKGKSESDERKFSILLFFFVDNRNARCGRCRERGKGMAEFRTRSKIMAAMRRKRVDHRSHLSTQGSRLTLRYERNSFLFYLSSPSFCRAKRMTERNWHIGNSFFYYFWHWSYVTILNHPVHYVRTFNGQVAFFFF